MSNFFYNPNQEAQSKSWAVQLKAFYQRFLSAEDAIALNTAKVTNATHTGEVTGSDALTLDKTAISNRSTITPASDDVLLLGDTSAGNGLGKATILAVLNGRVKIKSIGYTEDTAPRSTTSTSLVNITQSAVAATIATGDKALILLDAEVSHSLSNGQIVWNIQRNTTALATNDSRIYSHQAATHGQSHYVGKMFLDQPAAGSYTYYMAIRSLGGGTTYAIARGLTVIVFSTDY